MGFTVRHDLTVEELDNGFMVLPSGATHVMHLQGDQAEAFALAQHGADIVPAHLETAMAGLIEAGIVDTNTWSRRRIIQVGGVAAAASIAMVALPSVAAASSTPGGPTTGSVVVHLNMMDGTTMTAQSPIRLPATGTETVGMYSAADRTSTLIASTGTFLPANQTYVEYTFSGVTPGTYYVDIQQPFQGLGDAGFRYLGNPYWVEWNLAHTASPPVWLTKQNEYQQVVVTAGGTANVTLPIQVALFTTQPSWGGNVP